MLKTIKNNLIGSILAIVAMLFATPQLLAQRENVDLSNSDWALTLDRNASWEGDKLFVNPQLSTLPVNEPTGGWSLLAQPDKQRVHLPATVEGELWGWNGSTYGVTGNYVGVSWWQTKVNIPASWAGKRITLRFGAVRFRAEVFVNRKLAGYDAVNSTPFEIDITPYVSLGKSNEISVRITDPNGNFNWKDSQTYLWGNQVNNPSHGFGGITGRVSLVATPQEYIKDVFVENTPESRTVMVHVETTGNGPLHLAITPHGSSKVVWQRTVSGRDVEVHLPNAKLWDLDHPNLYDVSVTMGKDLVSRHFGFRWFNVGTVKGDRMFFLNGKRITIRTAISWSFWPDNGITPTRELAIKQVADAKKLGLTMLNFHRTIGNTDVLNAADSLGLLYFEEPGGNQISVNMFPSVLAKNGGVAQEAGGMKLSTDFAFAFRNEKLARMIKRDRSHPSLVIYNLHNERGAEPQPEDYNEMRMGHRLDPSRIMTYNSSNGKNPEGVPDNRFKLHLMPRDTTFYNVGWWDNHHAGGPGVYHDYIYQGKDNYLRWSGNKGEIVYWGEEGAIGTPPRLQLIRDEIMRKGGPKGWEAADYLNWYNAYDSFLHQYGFSKAFPSVDSLTRKMGNVAYYYQGRVIENIRISNTVDAYAINGWESMKLENHSGVVDNYRNLKGDAWLIARYNRPLYLAVKLNHKVLAVGDTTLADIYIVNEKNIHGSAQLKVVARDSKGQLHGSFTGRVKVSGGVVYGECLKEGLPFVMRNPGYTHIEATLYQNGHEVAKGTDETYAVNLNASGISGKGLVADTTGTIRNFMNECGIELTDYHTGRPQGDYMIVGAFEPQQFGSGYNDVLEWVYTGHTLIIVDNPLRWADLLADKEVLDYRGYKQLGTSWYGGNFFCRNHPVFQDLPSDCVFNWEYQCFAAYNRRRIGLRVASGDVIVGCVSDHKKEVYSAMSEIKAGRGRIIITTLDIPSCLQGLKKYDKPVDLDGMNESMNTFNNRGQNKANVIGQQLLLNLIRYATQTK